MTLLNAQRMREGQRESPKGAGAQQVCGASSCESHTEVGWMGPASRGTFWSSGLITCTGRKVHVQLATVTEAMLL